MYDLTKFALADMTRCGIAFRRLSGEAPSMETAASAMVRHLYEELGTPESSERACALARTFVTIPYGDLGPDHQAIARDLIAGRDPSAAMPCLTLLATAGDEPRWNARQQSASHQVLPLESEASVARSPMISQLIRQLGVDMGMLLAPESDVMLDVAQHSFNVFHVPDAPGSPHIPAQREFVEPYGIRSVLGFGGLLMPGQLFATILFSRRAIPRESAQLFRTLALNMKVALLPFSGGRVFS